MSAAIPGKSAVPSNWSKVNAPYEQSQKNGWTAIHLFIDWSEPVFGGGLFVADFQIWTHATSSRIQSRHCWKLPTFQPQFWGAPKGPSLQRMIPNGLYQNLALAVASHSRKRDFSKLWQQPPSKKKIWQTRPEQHRSPNSDSSQTLGSI